MGQKSPFFKFDPLKVFAQDCHKIIYLEPDKVMMKYSKTDQRGFTLIELISVIVIMGIMGSVVVKKFDVLSGTATAGALQEAVKELNVRETLVWTNVKFSGTGWTSDADLFAQMDTDLGGDFVWAADPDASGGKLSFGLLSINLSRTPSTNSSMGAWK